jgi:hypothetical protein
MRCSAAALRSWSACGTIGDLAGAKMPLVAVPHGTPRFRPRLGRPAGLASRCLASPDPATTGLDSEPARKDAANQWPALAKCQTQATGSVRRLRRLISTAATAAAQVELAAAAAPRMLPRPLTWRHSRSPGWRRSSRSA